METIFLDKAEVKESIIKLIESIKEWGFKDYDEGEGIEIPFSFWIHWIREVLSEVNGGKVWVDIWEVDTNWWEIDFSYEFFLSSHLIMISISWQVYDWSWLTVRGCLI